jgi:hypothetical protein
LRQPDTPLFQGFARALSLQEQPLLFKKEIG